MSASEAAHADTQFIGSLYRFEGRCRDRCDNRDSTACNFQQHPFWDPGGEEHECFIGSDGAQQSITQDFVQCTITTDVLEEADES